MSQVMVTIAGRVYRMACGEGEEARLTRLAQSFDRRIGELNASFKGIGDMRLHVMAALMVADELEEAGRRIAALEAEVASLKEARGDRNEQAGAGEARVAAAVTKAAERIERITRALAPAAQGGT